MTHSLDDLAAALPPLPCRLLAGLSGGADSVALVHLLVRRGAQVTAVHVHHGLRGDEADADEAFVRDMCRSLGVPLMTYHAAPPADPGEDWARQARYGFFREAMAATEAEAVALAHHRDDQAETLLLHLMRGCGLTGLCGMAAQADVLGVRVIRPLLDIPRQTLRDALTMAGIPWREDASNASQRYLRNAVRHRLVPLMEQLAPGAAAHLAHTADVLRQDEAALQQLTADFLQTHAGEDHLPLKPLRALPVGLRSRVLRAWCRTVCGDERSLSAEQSASVTALVDAPCGAGCSLNGGATVRRGWSHLHLLRADAPPCCIPVTLTATDGSGHGDGRRTQRMPRSLREASVIRFRQTGDWIRPFGMAGRQSLQDYFTNRRVDAAFRDRVPLLCRGSEVLLAAGVGAGDIPACPGGDDVLYLWQGDMPWLTNDTEGGPS